LSPARILSGSSPRHRRELDCEAKPVSNRIRSEGLLFAEYARGRCRPLIYRQINISTDEGVPKSLDGPSSVNTFAERIDRTQIEHSAIDRAYI
jgi:hypothetical protein